ncbi:diguanylate cyclase [Sphingomonas sp. NFR15]|uniref:GGDEF domain-containing protein n=1 Tax=Sphingomonas sp. NFR15 TaxID=1566282 RepID=UPI000884EEC2|nr:diguanylate cyclase [Sphingomonas sp. NFR15]SDA31049.1 diguanylate cyclase (GGDEF) domain-containing protein [Sphingomonas sp. NFR15]
MLVSLCAGAANAQVGPVGIPIRTCVLRDAPGLSAAKLFHAAGRFDCATPQARFGGGDFWLLSQPLDLPAAESRLAVRSSSVWQRAMTIYALYADGTIVSIRSDDVAVSRHLRLGAIFQRWLPRRSAPLVRLLWHVEGAANLRGILLAPTLATGGEVTRSDTHLAALYAGVGGACAALLLFNLGLAYALRHRFMPFYCLMMVALLAYDLSSSGTLAWLLPDIANTARMRINYVLLALVAVSALAFLRNFFEQRVMTLWLRRVCVAAAVSVGVPAIAIALFAPIGLRLFDTIYGIGFLFLLGSIVPILVNAWRRNSAFLPFFTIAWSLPIAFAAVRTASGLFGWPYHFWIDNSSVISMTVEALLSSLAIGHRVLLLTRERDEAREQEIAARLLADTDSLTGLLNRRAFLRGAVGHEGDFTLLLVDLDHFKHVNETIGHDGGDEVLRIFARTLRQALPAGALAARLGGEEFAVVIADPDEALAEDILDRLRHARMPFDITVTASIGQCRGPLAREADWKALYRCADTALFEAKKAGRDRVRGAPALRRFAA